MNPNKTEHRKAIIETFIHTIFLNDDKLILTFNFKDGTKTISFGEMKEAVDKKESDSDLNCLGALSGDRNAGLVFLSETGM